MHQDTVQHTARNGDTVEMERNTQKQVRPTAEIVLLPMANTHVATNLMHPFPGTKEEFVAMTANGTLVRDMPASIVMI